MIGCHAARHSKENLTMTLQRIGPATVAFALLSAPLLKAASSHTWVAGNGNDANPCTVTQPCATFTGALSVTNAGGIISVLSPGDFGSVLITKSITLDGGSVGGTITFTGEGGGIRVHAGISDTVILRHLVVNGLNAGFFGIALDLAHNVIIEDCDVEGFLAGGVLLESIAAMNVTVKNTRIIGGSYGVIINPSSGSVPYDVVSMRNVVVSGASGAAVSTNNGTMEISDSLITQSNTGLAAGTDAFINVANSVISYNATDVLFFPGPGPGGGIFVSDNCTLFGNNGYPGPPAGPASFVKLTPREQRPPDTPRRPQQ
jgi:hypothetical protein